MLCVTIHTKIDTKIDTKRDCAGLGQGVACSEQTTKIQVQKGPPKGEEWGQKEPPKGFKNERGQDGAGAPAAWSDGWSSSRGG